MTTSVPAAEIGFTLAALDTTPPPLPDIAVWLEVRAAREAATDSELSSRSMVDMTPEKYALAAALAVTEVLMVVVVLIVLVAVGVYKG